MTRKIEIVLIEKLEFKRRIELETDKSDAEIESLLYKVERQLHPEDAAYMLESEGVKNVKINGMDYGSPSDVELEVIEYRDFKLKDSD